MPVMMFGERGGFFGGAVIGLVLAVVLVGAVSILPQHNALLQQTAQANVATASSASTVSGECPSCFDNCGPQCNTSGALPESPSGTSGTTSVVTSTVSGTASTAVETTTVTNAVTETETGTMAATS